MGARRNEPRRKSWYDASAVESVRVVSQGETWGASRRRHARQAPGLRECLTYPLSDGPGVGLLLFLPLVLLFLSLPIFDVIAMLEPLARGDWALGLLALPIFLPLLFTLALVLGYGLLFFGHMFVASALGEPDHPRWPEWDPPEISQGLVRWVWAALFGLVLGGFPVVVYWINCGDIDWFDRMIFADMVIVGSGYALMTLAASLLHDSLGAANPITVLSAIVQTGWDFVMPTLSGGVALMIGAGALWGVLFRIPSLKLAVLGLWGFWVFVLYGVMVVLRMVGLTYHAHAQDLVWFTGRPRWGMPSRFGKIYSNS
ncbi:MAG: hypothetical protein NVSMB9_00070 [Isosphaeraceae bacterium]